MSDGQPPSGALMMRDPLSQVLGASAHNQWPICWYVAGAQLTRVLEVIIAGCWTSSPDNWIMVGDD